jgi:epoxyqueuosine reductase
MLRSTALTGAVRARAEALGFDRVAIGPATPPEHGPAFERWLAAGYAGTMDYLARGRDARLDPQRLLPGARSVIAVALNYQPASEVEGWTPVARYARGRDYHDVMRPRLATLAAALPELAGPETRARVCVDTSAVLERDLAARAGLGWIGKNTNLLDQGLGSFFFIGIVLTTAELVIDEPVADRCGTCTACLDACPTGAFAARYVLDARRCISYLTIEHRGPIDPDLRPAVVDWIFGCDVCQTVCPWNRRAPTTREAAFENRGPLEELERLLGLDDADFRTRFGGSAIRRAKRAGLVRNVALALGNRREVGAAPTLARLRDDPDPGIRDAVAWALERVTSSRDLADGSDRPGRDRVSKPTRSGA